MILEDGKGLLRTGSKENSKWKGNPRLGPLF